MKRKIINYLGLFLLLVVLPGMSWVYLSNGLAYQKAKRAELANFGKIPPFPYRLVNGDSIGEETFGGKLMLAFDFEAASPEERVVVLRELEKIHEQFDERKDVLFLLIAGNASTTDLNAMMKEFRLEDAEQVFPVIRSDASTGDFGISRNSNTASAVAIADSSGIVRQYYDFRDGNRVRRSVEHIAILMPFRDRDEAILRREKEK